MALINANEMKENSVNNLPKKSIDQMLNEIALNIKQCSDAGFFNVGYMIPMNTPIGDQEYILQKLNDNKYSLDTHESDEGLALNIKWAQPLP